MDIGELLNQILHVISGDNYLATFKLGGFFIFTELSSHFF